MKNKLPLKNKAQKNLDEVIDRLKKEGLYEKKNRKKAPVIKPGQPGKS